MINILTDYVPIKSKFIVALIVSSLWAASSLYISYPWLNDLSQHLGLFCACYLIGYIAIIPGFINSFLIVGLLLDRRPIKKTFHSLPEITILIAAYNESRSITHTIQSIYEQDYSGKINVIVINDGSSDDTHHQITHLLTNHPTLSLINFKKNQGKANALNAGLKQCKTDLIISIDGDCWVRSDAIKNIVERYLSDPPETKAVAGSILVKNSRENWIASAQEWDYFLGIASIKRVQSLFQGTLVAQGAFSIYDRATLINLGGWPNCVGEDIVLTWNLLEQGHRVGHAEDACVFTNCPNSISQFIKQRQRWSRGMIEAFKLHPKLLFKTRLSLIYILFNSQFPLMDIAFTIGFIPGIILACFGKFWIVGPMTLALIPTGILLNYVMYTVGNKMFKSEGLYIRNNLKGFITYVFFYSLILQPACVYGYLSEIFKFKKHWGTK